MSLEDRVNKAVTIATLPDKGIKLVHDVVAHVAEKKIGVDGKDLSVYAAISHTTLMGLTAATQFLEGDYETGAAISLFTFVTGAWYAISTNESTCDISGKCCAATDFFERIFNYARFPIFLTGTLALGSALTQNTIDISTLWLSGAAFGFASHIYFGDDDRSLTGYIPNKINQVKSWFVRPKTVHPLEYSQELIQPKYTA